MNQRDPLSRAFVFGGELKRCTVIDALFIEETSSVDVILVGVLRTANIEWFNVTGRTDKAAATAL